VKACSTGEGVHTAEWGAWAGSPRSIKGGSFDGDRPYAKRRLIVEGPLTIEVGPEIGGRSAVSGASTFPYAPAAKGPLTEQGSFRFAGVHDQRDACHAHQTGSRRPWQHKNSAALRAAT
jgi:hypothetical protein